MLGDKPAIATIAVKDMIAANKFYEGTLGLTKEKEDPAGSTYKSGSTKLFVYPSEFAGTNKATAVAWGVGDDLDKIVADLKTKGVTFEQYDNLPGVTRDGDVHVMGELRAVWFKDPDGNILNLVNQM
ncbi:MAG TPA: VOC family protein [Candidatus Saccharimonadales bacterium]